MSRHLPRGADTRFWYTGTYLFDYIHDSGIGGMFSSVLIGDENTNIPHIAMIDIKTEALGKYTGQLSLYLKVRGVTDIFYKKQSMDFRSLGLREILRNLKLNPIPDTPLHIELILQMEGKSVLSFYLNQTSFDSVAQGECKLMKVQLVVVCLYHFFSLICSDLSIDRDHLWGHTYKPTILPLAVREQIQCTDSIGNPRRSSNRDHRGHNRAGKYNQCDQGSAACLANRYAILELFAVSVFDLQPLPEL